MYYNLKRDLQNVSSSKEERLGTYCYVYHFIFLSVIPNLNQSLDFPVFAIHFPCVSQSVNLMSIYMQCEVVATVWSLDVEKTQDQRPFLNNKTEQL